MRKPKKAAVKHNRKPNKPLTLEEFSNLSNKYSPAPVLTLCGQLEDSVLLLENRISNVIAKINSLM